MARFEDAYEQYEALVRGFLTRLCGNRHLAEDLTQETFYQAMRHWNDFRGESSLSTWLCTIAKRLYYNECRRAPSLPLSEAEARADESDLAQRLIDGDQRVALFSLLHRLAGALPGGLHAAHLRRAVPRRNRRPVRQERELGARDLPPGKTTAQTNGRGGNVG